MCKEFPHISTQRKEMEMLGKETRKIILEDSLDGKLKIQKDELEKGSIEKITETSLECEIQTDTHLKTSWSY